jgi:hypothetical protein
MKKRYQIFGFLMLALAFVALNVSAQVRYVDVLPGVGTLNDAINGDTLETGERTNLNTVYRLQRGLEAYYGLTGRIENSGFPLTIVAADGDGPRPFLQPRVVGDASDGAFRPRANLTVRGLHVTGLDELGGVTQRMIRASADDISVTVDDCWFDKDGQSFIRVDNPGVSFYITNSVISNIGLPSSPDNGRGIDDRGNDIDTVIMENCTFYNLTSRIIRDGGGMINYAWFTNNTVSNIGQHGISFGPTGQLVFANNIFQNAGFMPMDLDGGRFVVSVDSVVVDSVTILAPEILADRNIFWMDSAKIQGYLNDTTIMPTWINPTLQAYFDATYGPRSIQVAEMIEFATAPPFNDSIIIYDQDPNLDRVNAPDWVEPAVPGTGEGGNGFYHVVVPYDFSWENNLAAKFSLDNTQMGDNNWTGVQGEFVGVDFERDYETVMWNQFANSGDAPENLLVVTNPDKSGANTSDLVMMFTVLEGADPWAGAWSDYYGTMTFTEDLHHMEMMVHKDMISNCGLKVEVGGTATELKVPNTVTGAWEAITFDFSAKIGETMSRLVFFPDFPDSRTAGSVSYLDNIKMVTAPVGIKKTDAVNLSVYPNPASDQLNVQARGMTSVTILDVLGKSVKSVQLQGEDRATISVEDLSQGVYFITIEATGGSKTTKFLKK